MGRGRVFITPAAHAMEATMSAPARQYTTASANSAAPFLRRTWNLLSDKTTDHIVCWNSDGKSFTVKQPELLSAVLPKRLGVFHETYAGFLRELSLYGFRCVGNDSYGVPVSFTVTNFERGKFENLGLVKRKGNYGRSRRT